MKIIYYQFAEFENTTITHLATLKKGTSSSQIKNKDQWFVAESISVARVLGQALRKFLQLFNVLIPLICLLE